MTTIQVPAFLEGQHEVVHDVLAHRPRHMPGSQPPLSLVSDPDQNKGDTSIISFVTNGVYIPLSRRIQFCPLAMQNFEKNAQDPGDPAESWIQDPSGFLPVFMGFKSFHQINLLLYKTL